MSDCFSIQGASPTRQTRVRVKGDACCVVFHAWCRSVQMTLLGTRLDETVAVGQASADKVNAIGSTSKTLSDQLAKLQQVAGDSLPELDKKVCLSFRPFGNVKKGGGVIVIVL